MKTQLMQYQLERRKMNKDRERAAAKQKESDEDYIRRVKEAGRKFEQKANGETSGSNVAAINSGRL